MMRSNSRRRLIRRSGLTVGLAALLAIAAACGSSPSTGASSSASTPESSVSSPAPESSSSSSTSAASTAESDTGTAAPGSTGAESAAALPAEIANAGALTIATSADYPPFESMDTDGSTIIGFDPDLGTALGKALGIKITFTNASFDGLIPGLASNKYQAVMAGMQDIKARQDTVTFVDYIQIGSELAVAKGNPHQINGFADLCGLAVAAQTGTTQASFAQAQSKSECTAKGKKPIEVQVYTNNNNANLAVTSGRAAAVFSQTATQAVAVKQSGQIEVVGPVYDKNNVGIGFPKGQDQLAKAFEAAVQKVMDDGTYLQLAKKWGLDAGAITKASIDDALS